MQNSIQVSAPNGDALKLFRPSSAPALELCSHFESVTTPSPNKIRGSNFHLAIAEIFKAVKEEREIRPEMANGFTDQCDWALQILAERTNKIEGIEVEVTLYDADHEFITSGTLDLWRRNTKTGRVEIIDWKTGQERDYWAQLSIYALAVLEGPDMELMDEIDLTLAFVDQQRAFTQRFSRDELRRRVDSLIEAVRDPASPYFINAYCSYCDCRDSCPAWAAERNLVAGLDGSASLAEKFSVLKSDPEKLARFIVAFRRLRNMVEKVEQLDSVALGMIQSGATMPGLQLIKRKATEWILASKIEEMFSKLDIDELDTLLSVDLKEAKRLWEKHMPAKKFPKITVGEPTEYLALKK